MLVTSLTHFFLHVQGYLEENDIHQNKKAGVDIMNDANPIIERCTIHHGSSGGVYVHDMVCARALSNSANTCVQCST